MSIIIRITKAPAETGLEGKEFPLKEGQLSLGRNPSNDVCLPDEQRILSSQHLLITKSGDIVQVCDLSTNGSFLNTRDNRLTKNESVTLTESATLLLGAYEIDIPLPSLTNEIDKDLGGGFLDGLNQETEFAPAAPKQELNELDQWLEVDAQQKPDEIISAPLSSLGDSGDISPGNDSLDPLAALSGSTDTDGLLAASSTDDDWWRPEQPDSPPLTETPDSTPFAPPNHVEAARLDDSLIAPKKEFSSKEPSPSAPKGVTGESPSPFSNDDQGLVESYSIAIDGLIRLLRARSSVKNEMRVDRTIIGARENNPLKFSANAEDAMKLMFGGISSSFLDSKASVEEAVQDLEDHQAALLAGLKQAYLHMLSRFAPDNFSDSSEKSGNKIRQVMGSKSKPWEDYSRFYDALKEDMEESYNKLFGNAFSQTYEEELKRLKNLR